MTLKTCAAAAVALATATVATTASADNYRFELNGAHQAVWNIDSSQPTEGYAPGESSLFADVYGNFSGLPGFSTVRDDIAFITFYTDDVDGAGFYIEDYYGRPSRDVERPILTTNGPSVIAGDTRAPTFLPGYYIFSNVDNANERYSLTITAVPEPASWAMMLAGFAMAGAALRRRRKDAVAHMA